VPCFSDACCQRGTYNGPLEFGEDLMTINIGNAITMERPAKK
jgi:hypothetical protein